MMDDRREKLKGQMQMRFNAVLSSAYAMHGYKNYAPGVTHALMELVEESWDIVQGEEKPLSQPNVDYWDALR